MRSCGWTTNHNSAPKAVWVHWPSVGTLNAMELRDWPDSQHTELLRKLRVRPLSFWGSGDRVVRTREALTELAQLGWRAEFGGAGEAPEVPDAGVHVLVDQLQVLIVDAQLAGVPVAEGNRVVAALADALGVRLK